MEKSIMKTNEESTGLTFGLFSPKYAFSMICCVIGAPDTAIGFLASAEWKYCLTNVFVCTGVRRM